MNAQEITMTETQERIDAFQARLYDFVETALENNGHYQLNKFGRPDIPRSLFYEERSAVQAQVNDSEQIERILEGHPRVHELSDQIRGIPREDYDTMVRVDKLIDRYVSNMLEALYAYTGFWNKRDGTLQAGLSRRVEKRNRKNARAAMIDIAGQQITLESLPDLIRQVHEAHEDYMFSCRDPCRVKVRWSKGK